VQQSILAPPLQPETKAVLEKFDLHLLTLAGGTDADKSRQEQATQGQEEE
jgi:hypothetical protein